MIRLKPLIISLLISLGTGGLASLLVGGGMSDYENFNKPPLSPPGWVFPVVWTILYILMGISAYIIWTSEKDFKRTIALWAYAVQLAINFIWTITFFGFDAYLAAFLILVILWLAIAFMIIAFRSVNKTAAYLQIPYLLWVTFAGYLNFSVWLLNK
jgi:Tryptophan-rich sensory protein (mitochondrial benzodiazepine receptor homolog)